MRYQLALGKKTIPHVRLMGTANISRYRRRLSLTPMFQIDLCEGILGAVEIIHNQELVMK